MRVVGVFGFAISGRLNIFCFIGPASPLTYGFGCRVHGLRPRPRVKSMSRPSGNAVISNCCGGEGGECEQIRKTQDEPQWIVAQRLLSALTIPGFG